MIAHDLAVINRNSIISCIPTMSYVQEYEAAHFIINARYIFMFVPVRIDIVLACSRIIGQ